MLRLKQQCWESDVWKQSTAQVRACNKHVCGEAQSQVE